MVAPTDPPSPSVLGAGAAGAGGGAATGSYGLREPTPADAHAAITRVCGANAPQLWSHLLTAANVTGEERDRSALESILAAMDAAEDALVRLCAHPLRIRLASYDRLSAAYALLTPAGTP